MPAAARPGDLEAAAVVVHADALRKLAGQDLQRRRQAQVRQRRGHQVLDDALLQGHAFVEGLFQLFQALPGVGTGRAYGALEPGRVELGHGEQGAQFVVQVARQPAAFVLVHGVQVACQFAQVPGAAGHLGFELQALGLQGLGVLAPHAVDGTALVDQQHQQQHGQALIQYIKEAFGR